MTAKAFLTGGGGFIGGALATALRARGEPVLGLARSEAAARSLAARDVEVVRGDVLDASGLTSAMAGCRIVYHVAGVNSHCPRDPQHLMRVNVEGTANVVRAAAAAGVGRVVFTSSAAAIGEAQGTVATESSPHRGSYLSLYERSKHEAERLAFDLAADAGVEIVALSPSSVQGPPRRSGNGAIIIAYLNGRLRAFVESYLSIVDVEDVVEAHLLAAARGRPGERYILNGATIPARQALSLLAELSGIDHAVPTVPAWLARSSATILDAALRLGGRTSPLCRARVDTLLHGHRYDGSLATRELGVKYTPLAETLTRTIEWALHEGLVNRR